MARQLTRLCVSDTGRARTSSTMPRSCRPISAKTTFSSRNPIVRQLVFSAMRDEADCSTGDRWPSTRPVTTTASTPEAWISSAGRNAANGATKDRVVSSTGSSMCLRM